MDAVADEAFIRRAVELADLNAVRIALFHHTRDPEIGALPITVQLDAAGRELLVSRAVAWLLEHADSAPLAAPSEEELRSLIEMVKHKPMTDLEFDSMRTVAAFEPFPAAAQWEGERPELPAGFHVAVIGGGFSGIAMGVQCELLGIPYTVIERQPEPGGTWARHRYPDIRVDTASVGYEYGFEKNYPWTEYFARGPEVRQYAEYVSKKYGVHEHCRFGCELERAVFDENRNVWVLTIATPSGRETLEANAIVTGAGTFANPKIPTFEGQESFEGIIVHPSRWPDGWEAAGRRVAVIGNGSTGVQMVSPIARESEQTFVFQRTPQWISPRPNYGKVVEPEIRWLFDHFPGYWNWAHYMAIAFTDLHDFLIADEEWVKQGGLVNAASDGLRDVLIGYIKAQTGGREDLVERLIPDYPPFVRRLIVDNGWYEALARDNVELVTSPIVRLTPKGIETADGRVHEVDTIVTATGFEISEYLKPASFTGVGGVDLHDDVWSVAGPRAYISVMIPEMPNMFMLYGPNGQPTSGGAGLHHWWVLWSAFAGRCLMRMLEQNATRVEVTSEAFERYNRLLDEKAATLVYIRPDNVPDKNYYVDDRYGRLQVNAPWRGAEFHRWVAQNDWDDLRFS